MQRTVAGSEPIIDILNDLEDIGRNILYTVQLQLGIFLDLFLGTVPDPDPGIRKFLVLRIQIT
jgi:hypothetical protein